MKRSKKLRTDTSVFERRLAALRDLLERLGRAGEVPAPVVDDDGTDDEFVARSVRYGAYRRWLTDLAAGEDAVVSLAAEPAVSAATAARAARKAGGRGRGRLGEARFFVVWFRLAVRSVREVQERMGLAWDVERGLTVPALFDILQDADFIGATWRRLGPTADLERQVTALLRRSQDEAVRRAEAALGRVRQELAAVRRQRKELLDDYLDVVTRECEEDQKSIYFHLYYFEQEEKLKKRLNEARQRLERLNEEDDRLFAATAEVVLDGAALLQLPVWRFDGPTVVDGLTGKVLHDG